MEMLLGFAERASSQIVRQAFGLKKKNKRVTYYLFAYYKTVMGIHDYMSYEQPWSKYTHIKPVKPVRPVR